jgi:hypothetical protein
MIIDKQIQESLANRISKLDTEDNRNAYREGRFPRADKVQDLDMRYRWDLFHATKCRELVPSHANSEHIDTALRRIVPKLKGE